MATRLSVGIRVIAVFEAAKAALVLLAGFGLAALVHRDLPAVAADLVTRLHLNPAKHYPQIFICAAGRLTDWHLWLLAALALAYSALRSIEAYGLWYGRPWAEWIALLSAGLYLPVEIFELTRAVTVIRIAALIINLGVLLFMASTLRRGRGTQISS